MADFCKQCSIDSFGRDTRDLADLFEVPPNEGVGNSWVATALCEGCGLTEVDHDGNCVGPCEEAGRPGHGPA